MSDSKPRRSGKKGGGRERRLQSGSYSTRFEPTHQELVEQACRILNWTPARFIRDAAVRRAAEVINSAGPSRYSLAALAAEMVKHLKGNNGVSISRWIEDEKVYRHADVFDTFTDPEVGQEGFVEAAPLDLKVRGSIKAGMKACPSEFVRLLLEQWELSDQGADSFTPKVDLSQLRFEEEPEP